MILIVLRYRPDMTFYETVKLERLMKRVLPVVAALAAASARPVLAAPTQVDPAEIVVTPYAHLFFIAALGILIYRLIKQNLARAPGWREIKYAAIFFILWSVAVLAANLLDGPLGWVVVNRMDGLMLTVEPRDGFTPLAWFYSIIKRDHLLLVPAMVFLYRGISRLSEHHAAHHGRAGEGGS